MGVNIDGVTHLFSGQNSMHYIWNDDEQNMKEIEPSSWTGIEPWIFGVFQLKSQNKVLVIEYYSMMIFEIKQNKWHKIGLGIQSFSSLIGSRSEAPASSGAVMTLDKKHVIIAVSEEDKGDDIYVLKIGTYALRKSTIHCPKEGLHHLVICNDMQWTRSLVIGYIKSLNSQLPFMDVINIIVAFYWLEMIHWFEWNTEGEANEHYAISVDDIISSVDFNSCK